MRERLNLVKKGEKLNWIFRCINIQRGVLLTINFLTLGYSCPNLSFTLHHKVTIHIYTHAFITTF
jgi:hypothetical protein